MDGGEAPRSTNISAPSWTTPLPLSTVVHAKGGENLGRLTPCVRSRVALGHRNWIPASWGLSWSEHIHIAIPPTVSLIPTRTLAVLRPCGSRKAGSRWALNKGTHRDVSRRHSPDGGASMVYTKVYHRVPFWYFWEVSRASVVVEHRQSIICDFNYMVTR